MHFRRLFVVYMRDAICFCFAPLPLFSAPIILTDSIVEIPVGLDAEFLEDASGQLTIRDVASSQTHWQVSKSRIMNFGVSRSVFWVRLSLRNESRNPDWVLEFLYPLLDYVFVYTMTPDGKFVERRSGRMFPFSSREFKHKNLVFSMNAESGMDQVVYVRIRSEGSLNCAMSFWRLEALNYKLENEKFYLGLYFGIMLIMALYNFSLFLTIRDRAYLWYVLYVISLSTLQLLIEGLMLEFIVPENPALTKLLFYPSFFAAWLVASFFVIRFLDLNKNAPKLKLPFYVIMVTAAVGGFVGSIVSYSFGSKIAVPFVFVTPVVFFVAGAIALRKGYRPAKYFLIGWSAFLVSAIIYGLRVSGKIQPSFATEHGTQIGSALEVLLLSLALGDRFNVLRQEKEQEQSRSLQRQETLTNSYARFVPTEIMGLLKKKAITEVALGDAIQQEMTILFSDIRSFTTMSESMTPKENFEFLNALMRRTGPAIRENHGFVDKFIGDAIMALFPRSPENAVKAAIQMKRNLLLYNVRRSAQGFQPLKVGIGINTGLVMLGTIGEPERMDGTVISDTVNLASRIEGLTKHYDATLLITEQTLFRLEDPTKYKFRLIERVKVKGKNDPVSIFEVFEGDADDSVLLKTKTQGDFEHGVQDYQNANFASAENLFRNVLDADPSDGAARLYLQKSEHFAAHGAPPDWEAVAVMESK